MDISQRISLLKETIPAGVTLVAVSKNHSPAMILEAYESGHRDFGENRAQELLAKCKSLPEDINWHFIGHLQRNKVKDIVPVVHMIHSVESLRLFSEIENEASHVKRVVQCLLQFHIAREETKFGLDLEEAVSILESDIYKAATHARIAGVMGMATYTDDINRIREEFSNLYSIFSLLRKQFFRNEESFRELSMGMSGDYGIALEEGSTILRIGSLIFGER